ncbi:MAG: hypothetical protein PHQ75_13100 [Thermoguttaceae bacterium]|nr:hypothetical protein [Thermoguttaceae bacterium]
MSKPVAVHIARSGFIHEERITKNCGCRLSSSERKEKPVRSSCLECVEKHLGAAAVLLSEIHNGYSYRFFLIGHLHEAEEEIARMAGPAQRDQKGPS